MECRDADVIIIGAGMAGLTAARRLAESGRRAVLLEAQNHVGGRLRTVRDPNVDLPIELGAEFVHGKPEDLLALLREARLSLFELDGENHCFRAGMLAPCSQDGSFEILSQMQNYAGPDLSFADYLKSNPADLEKARAIGYIEGFNAADQHEISVQALIRQQRAEDAIEGDRLFRVVEGYAALTDFQCLKFEGAGGIVRLGTRADAVRWHPRSIEVTTSQGEFRAGKIIIAVPLGVLHSGALRFDPQPLAIAGAARQLAMGPVHRIVLVFRERFWATSPLQDRLSFLFSDTGLPATWWTPHPHPAATLTGWMGGTRATTLYQSAQAESTQAAWLLEQSLAQLARFFSIPIEAVRDQLAGFHFHDWQTDPYSRGAYSYARVGGVHASERMVQPVDDTLFFAGEHTDTSGHWGTVHGALRSGIRAAEQVLRS